MGDSITPVVRILGIPVAAPTRSALATAIEHRLQAGATQPTTRLFTLNPEILEASLRDPAYRAVLMCGDWNLIDGIGLALAIRLRCRDEALSRALPAGDLRIPGSDIVYDLAELTERAQRPFLLLGGTPRRLQKACERLRARFPRLEVHGISPPYSESLPIPNQVDVERLLLSVRPATVVVCLGAPKQEAWIERSSPVLREAGVAIAAGLGGTVDFLSGEIPRAPSFVRRVGMEWLFRLWVEPSRWRRQLRALPRFAMRSVFSPRFVRPAIAPTDSQGGTAPRP